METSELKIMQKQFEQVMKDNERMNFIKQQYVENAKSLIALSEQLDNIRQAMIKLAREIDPVLNAERIGRKHNSKEDMKRDLYETMRNGTYITRDLIEKTYPELDKNNVGYILMCLENMPHVEKVKDGRNVRLFFNERFKS